MSKLVDKLEDNEIMLVMKKLKTLLVLSSLFLATSCYNKQVNVVPENSNKLTLGKIQQTLKKGMSQGEVVAALGSPNLVTTDALNLETWVYDKLSTEVSLNSKKKGILGGVIGSKIGIGVAGGSSSKSSNTSSTQKTLTVVIKFKEKKIDTYTYNASTF